MGFPGGKTKTIVVDLTNILTNPPQPVLAGQTWTFQLWHRDVSNTANFTQAVEITSESEEFVALIEALELTAKSETHAMTFTAAPNTLKLGLPFLLAFVYEYPFAGKNTIIFDPAVRVVTQFFLPLW